MEPQKKRGPAPTGKGESTHVRLLPPITTALDAWIAAQPEPRPSRPEAIRLALKDWLTGLGLLHGDKDARVKANRGVER